MEYLLLQKLYQTTVIPTTLRLIAFLMVQPNYTWTEKQSNLACELETTQSNLWQILNTLEKNGVLTINKIPGERAREIRLSKEVIGGLNA